jgi:hypothetical protein
MLTEEDVFRREATKRLTVKQVQINSRIPPTQFGGFSALIISSIFSSTASTVYSLVWP